MTPVSLAQPSVVPAQDARRDELVEDETAGFDSDVEQVTHLETEQPPELDRYDDAAELIDAACSADGPADGPHEHPPAPAPAIPTRRHTPVSAERSRSMLPPRPARPAAARDAIFQN